MKKSILMLGLAVAAMTSCTNDEVLEQAQSVQKAIGFESFVNKGTRAEAEAETVTVTNEVTAENLTRFYVYGYHNGTTPTVFDNVSVIKSGNVWSMKTENERDWETQSYNFAAYADGVGEASHVASTLTTSFTNATLTFTNYTVNSDQTKQTDLIAAVTARDNTNTLDVTTVDLDFKHLLSKVDFTFSNTNENNLSMVVSDVTLKVKTKASCAYSSSSTTWSGWDTETTYTLAQPSNGNDENLFGGESELKNTQKKFIIEKGSASSVSLRVCRIPSMRIPLRFCSILCQRP